LTREVHDLLKGRAVPAEDSIDGLFEYVQWFSPDRSRRLFLRGPTTESVDFLRGRSLFLCVVGRAVGSRRVSV
ncbi:MAG TPA: hypothetical protein VGC79_12460, partial [Polyangiaceae bacterium]